MMQPPAPTGRAMMLDAARGDGLAAPAGAALVRVRATDGSWIHRVPALPDGLEVTVSIGSTAHRDVSDLDLVRTGYRIVGPQPSSGLPEAVELLVPASLMAAQPRWWRDLLEVADQAYDLRLGPVQMILGSHLTVHGEQR